VLKPVVWNCSMKLPSRSTKRANASFIILRVDLLHGEELTTSNDGWSSFFGFLVANRLRALDMTGNP
jgi:hypothetical protein